MLYRIAEGLAYNAYRKDQRDVLVDSDAIQELENLYSFTTYGTYQESPFFADSFDESLRGLDDDARAAFILLELRGLTSREAADVLDASHMTIHRRAEIARHILAKEIAA